MKIPVEISARHIHLSKQDLEKLFGKNYQLKISKQLTQPSDFACQETVTIKADKGIIENVRVMGPVREKTQVEISLTDAFKLGVKPPVRLSGDLKNSSPITILGLAGEVSLKEGLIIAKRHIHCSKEEAKEFGFKNGQTVSVKISGERETTFHNITARIGEKYKLCLHLDTDEGNSAGIDRAGEGTII
jgi:putative phosphotransacetylase